MALRARVGVSSRSGAGRTAPQTYEGTMSGYGATRADSVGYAPPSPKRPGVAYNSSLKAFMPTQSVKTDPNASNT